MAEILNDEAVAAVSGGAGNINTTDWAGGHWQATQYPMGSTFHAYGYTWYRIKSGDSLGSIAAAFGTSVNALMANNPNTIKNPNQIFAGDALIIRAG